MNTVEPIREFEMIINIMDYFKQRSERNYLMFCFGIYVPMRISDILKLKVRDVKGKKYVSTREDKTNKEQLFPINDAVKGIISEYIEGMDDYEYLFASRQKNKEGYYGHITRQQAYNIMNQAADEFGIEKVGCHTLRKTFGFHHYQQNKDIVTLQEIYRHSDISITKRYIGITQDIKNKSMMDFKYKRLSK